jgi:hypothetical protein
MWEEHPEYQKQQAKLLGVLLVLLFIYGMMIADDWEDRKQVITFAACFVAAAATFPLVAWFLIKLAKLLRPRRGQRD